ncbi:MAG: type IV conjugative transfer system protein TraL [Desulfurococcaceae archaeon]
MHRFKVPQYLHLPYQVLFFELDDLLLIMLFIFISVYFSFTIGLIILVFLIVYMKMKKRFGRGYLIHLFYAIGVMKFKGYPTYFEKRFYD